MLAKLSNSRLFIVAIRNKKAEYNRKGTKENKSVSAKAEFELTTKTRRLHKEIIYYLMVNFKKKNALFFEIKLELSF